MTWPCLAVVLERADDDWLKIDSALSRLAVNVVLKQDWPHDREDN